MCAQEIPVEPDYDTGNHEQSVPVRFAFPPCRTRRVQRSIEEQLPGLLALKTQRLKRMIVTEIYLAC